VVLVSFNTAHLLDRLFAALQGAKNALRVQLVVVDNASADNSVEVLRKYPEIKLLENAHNVGFARAVNQALPHVRGRYVLLLNTDAFVAPDTLVKTIDFMDTNPRCGVLGVKLIGEDGSLQPCCRYFPTPWNVFLASTGLSRIFPKARLVDDMSWDHASVRECDWVPGCYYLVRREVIDRVGLFDARFFLYGEEIDHCRAVHHAGWSVVYYPFTHVVHLGGGSATSVSALTQYGRQISRFQVESELLYFRKHHGLSGVLSAVCLALLGDCLLVVKALLRPKHAATAAQPLRHAWDMLTILAATWLASRSTR
jgi:GT2 family glycosyltransferase